MRRSWLHLKAIQAVLWAERDADRDSELPLGNLPSPSSHASRHLVIHTQIDLLKPNTCEAFIHPPVSLPWRGWKPWLIQPGTRRAGGRAPGRGPSDIRDAEMAAQALVALI